MRAREGRQQPVPCLKHILKPAGPRDLEALSLSQTGTGQVLAEQPKGRARALSPGSQLAHIRMHGAGNQVTNPWKVVSFFFFFF